MYPQKYQQPLYSVYGAIDSFYGNIGLAVVNKIIQHYGGWPYHHPNIQENYIRAEVDRERQERLRVAILRERKDEDESFFMLLQ